MFSALQRGYPVRIIRETGIPAGCKISGRLLLKTTPELQAEQFILL